MSKDQNKQDIVYALADYKQLVLAYKSKYSELIKKVVFWRVTAFWLLLFSAGFAVAITLTLSEIKNDLAEGKNSIGRLHSRVEAIVTKLDQTQQELMAAKEELRRKDILIKQLEQNVSNNSKEMLERLLKE